MIAGRAFAIWLVIILAETVHGVLRSVLLVPLVGDLRARQIGVLIGCLIVFAITFLFVSWLRVDSISGLLSIGAIWVVLTFLFELALGRLILGVSWDRILSDYHIANGGYMIFGLLFMFFAPYLASHMKSSHTVNP